MAVFNESDSDDDGEPKHPLVMLAKAARVMNAQQMDLSKDLVSHVNLPGNGHSEIMRCCSKAVLLQRVILVFSLTRSNVARANLLKLSIIHG